MNGKQSTSRTVLSQTCRLAGLLLLLFCACTRQHERERRTEMQAFADFFHAHSDSIGLASRLVRRQALQRMQASKDSLARYNYLTLALKTCLITSDIDSARLLVRQVESFAARQPFTPQVADLLSECSNMKGNIHARSGSMDSAARHYQRAYDYRMQGTHPEALPDILINLADANNRLGKLDVGAAWYRRALRLCDSLQVNPSARVHIYYGLAQINVALRDFDQCDYYYELAAQHYDEMLPQEKHFYLNNRGTSYYYREEYAEATAYFRRATRLVEKYPDMIFELNLSRLNLADCFLRQGEADSAACYIALCSPFFEEIGMPTALYYIDTQQIQLALLRKDFSEARRLLADSTQPAGVDPEMVQIRNKYLQQYCEMTGNYPRAYHYLKENARLDDSIRNERIRMRKADLALRYGQDSTLMAQQVFIRQKENELLSLRQRQGFWISLSVLTLLTVLFAHLYNKKKHALFLARNRRTVSSLRLENIRNRLSPHFIFNVLNREMAGRTTEDRPELSALIKLMRRNLELAEQLCVTLTEELDFVETFLELEGRSMGSNFSYQIDMDKAVQPDQVKLPSMLIQIPVENALKHALREKEGKRLLHITIRRQGQGTSIRIVDNGGGYRPESQTRGTGTGMKVIMQTIQILNSCNRETIDASVHDIPLPDGETGCEVAFLLPDRYNYEI